MEDGIHLLITCLAQMLLKEFIEHPGQQQVVWVPSEEKIVQNAIWAITGESIEVELDSEDNDGGKVEEVFSVSEKLQILALAKYNTAVQAILYFTFQKIQ
ncbi:hypothetical protein HDU93_006678 [Gonapodya sp. JEL0774]|nr:hypothetical protein HDU93_006678 [Gonapodya sp. JEL0774]